MEDTRHRGKSHEERSRVDVMHLQTKERRGLWSPRGPGGIQGAHSPSEPLERANPADTLMSDS